jgi:aspartyl-tRNA(Asn)/glutamyl-tRNA(Gln) amidotransferase subunit B
MDFEAIIGLEVHAELQTQSKMFCACPVVEPSQAAPNSAVCPVCAGMPGMLPVVNQRAVEYGLRVALALNCEILPISIFARKNYFYPDLPKGYQITQYEYPLARNGQITIPSQKGERIVRIRRVHLEEDTGKLTHISAKASPSDQPYTLVDLNRAGVPLVEIVSEPDMHTAEEVRAYATALWSILRYLGVNSGDMQKGVLRIEPNISLRPIGQAAFGTKVEIKNLNSFRALERAVAFEIIRQGELLVDGQAIQQETRGWDDSREVTFSQRVKEEADDYRYFPEPDLPPLVIAKPWLEQVKASLPELPIARLHRFQDQYGLSAYDADILTAEKATADYFEAACLDSSPVSPKIVANWITGELYGLLNQANIRIEDNPIPPSALAALLQMVVAGEVNNTTGRVILVEMFTSGKSAAEIAQTQGLRQISDPNQVGSLVQQVLKQYPQQVKAYLEGKESLFEWFFGQVMRAAGRQANPQIVRIELERQLKHLHNKV